VIEDVFADRPTRFGRDHHLVENFSLIRGQITRSPGEEAGTPLPHRGGDQPDRRTLRLRSRHQPALVPRYRPY
jgi:hypothetical protein